jgi:hypothetical protein
MPYANQTANAVRHNEPDEADCASLGDKHSGHEGRNGHNRALDSFDSNAKILGLFVSQQKRVQ